MLAHTLVLISGFLISLGVTPLVRKVAISKGIIDKPDSRRKLHGRVVARAGGTAVLISILCVCGIALLGFDLVRIPISSFGAFVALLAAMVAMWLLGLADDIWVLRGRQKLLGQMLVALGLAFSGFEIEVLSLFGFDFRLGLLAIPITVFWLLATTNALNLIDGSDGLCSTLGAVICGSLGVLAANNGHFAEATIAFAMCGALLGFLVYNFPPASIFLGDSGSLLVGVVTGALAIRCSLKGPTGVAMLAPLAILCLPLLDSTMAIVRRKLTGRSIYTTDRAHLHHSLKGRGLSDKGLLLAVAVMALTTAFFALIGQLINREWVSFVGVAAVIGLLVSSKAFGYAELVLVARRASMFTQSFFESAAQSGEITRQKGVRLQGTRQWETVWQELVHFAEKEELSKLRFDLNVPWLEEGFHGTWQRSRLPDKQERWTVSLPVFGGGQIAGRIEVIGPAIQVQNLGCSLRLTALVEDLTPQVELLMTADATVGPQQTEEPEREETPVEGGAESTGDEPS